MVKNEYKHLNTASTICSNMDQKDQHDVLAILSLLQLFLLTHMKAFGKHYRPHTNSITSNQKPEKPSEGRASQNAKGTSGIQWNSRKMRDGQRERAFKKTM